MTARPDVTLRPMTLALCHAFYRGFQNDPDIYMDLDQFHPFQYHAAWVNAYFAKQNVENRRYFAIFVGETIVGELILKQIDPENACCTLSIHLQNDTVKGKGYGTAAECLAVQYAFDVLGVRRVLADVVLKNARSQHVLEKLGFHRIKTEGAFCFYELLREDYGNFLR